MSHIDKGKEALSITIKALTEGLDSINNEFESAVQLIEKKVPPGRLIVMGMGKSGHIAAKLAATFASTGTPAFFVHPGEAGHGDLGMITKEDIILALSQSGESEEIKKIIPFILRNNIPLIALTGKRDSTLSSKATISISTAVKKESCPLDLAPTASTSLSLAIGDALAVCLLESKGFDKEDFASTHPLGELGRRLTIYVSDIMSPLEDSAIVNPSFSLKATLFEVTKGGLGFAIIVDDSNFPIGVFTDGDLRRSLDRELDIDSVQVSELMSKKFVQIAKEKLAYEALVLMKNNKVSGLPVIDSEGKVSGMINMRQLLQAGIV